MSGVLLVFIKAQNTRFLMKVVSHLKVVHRYWVQGQLTPVRCEPLGHRSA